MQLTFEKSLKSILAVSAASFILSLTPTANATDCLLDTSNDGLASNNVDTVGGASSSGSNQNLACGHSAVATGGGSIALGTDSEATMEDASAVGVSSLAVGLRTTAMGSFSWATTTNASALGHFARATGSGSTALGTGATTGFDNSIAIGAGATTTEVDQIVIKAADTFTILGNGDMGLGTATPFGTLDVDAGTDSATLVLSQDGTTPTQWEIKNNEVTGRMTIGPIGGNVPFKFGSNADDNLLRVGTAANNQVDVTGNLVLRQAGSATEWELKSNATTGRLTFGVKGNSDVPLKFGPTANNNLLRIGTGANNRVDIAGNLVTTGTLTTGGPTCGGGCDAVFDADYDLPSIEDHAAQMFANKHLPAIGPTVPHAPVNLSEQYGNLLNELEKAHIYIAQQQAELTAVKTDKQAMQSELEEKISRQELRLARLEALLNK